MGTARFNRPRDYRHTTDARTDRRTLGDTVTTSAAPRFMVGEFVQERPLLTTVVQPNTGKQPSPC